MNLRLLQTGPVEPRRGAGRGADRQGFSMVELLVAMSIMVVLLGLVSAAVSAARASTKKQATRLLISKLDAIIQQQFASYSSRTVPPPAGTLPSGWTKAAYRSWYIRRNLITGDLPDRWSDVAALASGTVPLTISGTEKLPATSPQRTYAAVLVDAARRASGKQVAAAALDLGVTYAGAECLFMIVMQGGVANCLDCGELRTAERGDKDGDGAYEFWDAWGNPIGFILWPAALELPVGTAFFTGSRALEPPFPPLASGTTPSPALGMRPLIYSAGPDGEYGFDRGGEIATLTLNVSSMTPVGCDCGNWQQPLPMSTFAGPLAGPDFRADNLTNFDAEVAK